MNKVFIIGNLTKDPEVRETPSGVAVTSFTLAVNRKFSNQQGEREADFIPIVTWRKLAETCGQFLTKGRKVAVVGRLQTRSYEDNAGQRRLVTEVVADEVEFLTPKGEGGQAPARGNGYGHPVPGDEFAPAGKATQYHAPAEEDDGFIALNDEDEIIPF